MVRADNSESHEVSMKRIMFAVFLSLLSYFTPLEVGAQPEEPTIYVIQKGDTLWGLSDRFLKDPFYWPNLWARNQKITNPHLIYPGQRVKIYPDRIEIVEEAAPQTQPVPVEQPAAERTFTITGAEGFLLEDRVEPSGSIIQTIHKRLYVGQEDTVYTDIGANAGAKVGDRYSIYKKMQKVHHPVTGDFMGYKILSMGNLRLTEVAEKSSSAVITKSYLEIGAGNWLLPYRDKRRVITLKGSDRELDGYIVDSRMGNLTIGAEDVVFLDLGKAQGLEVGNLLYVLREVPPNPAYVTRDVGKLPRKVIGAVVVVDLGNNTSTALVVKSTEELFPGDQVKLLKR